MKPIDATKYMRQLKYLPDITPWCGILMAITIIIFMYLPGRYIEDLRELDKNLPQSKYAHYEPKSDSIPNIVIKKNGDVYLHYNQVKKLKLLPTILIEKMEEMGFKDPKILLTIDNETPWGKVREVMQFMKEARIEVAGLITDSNKNNTLLDYFYQQKLYREKGLREPASAK